MEVAMNRCARLLGFSLIAASVAGCATDAISTTSGDVVGTALGGVSRFLGVPYAEPPVGDRRFRPPAPPAPWTEPLKATDVGPSCLQAPGGLAGSSGQDEDCLRLNIWTPSLSSDAKLPVMVFIHGGAFITGSGGDALYDGARLAEKGQVVVVTINYRLGVFGFLAHPALIAEDPNGSAGNYGLLDQQLALKWVQSNIEAFGGDPANVTIFGESAGAASVCAHMASPLAGGLFQRAIGESGSCIMLSTPLLDDPSQSHESAVSLGKRVAEALGCDAAPDAAACLRDKPTKDVLEAVPAKLDLNLSAAQYGPNIDGWVLPIDVGDAFQSGNVTRVPYLSGANKDEGTLFTVGVSVSTRAELEELIQTSIPDHASEALTLYPEDKYPNAHDALSALIGDLFLCTQRLQARFMSTVEPKTFFYHFTRENLAGSLTGLGAFHGTELPYVFHNFNFPFIGGAEEEKLSEAVIGYWTRFAKTGDPNGGAVTWPAMTEALDYLDIDATQEAGTNLNSDVCDAMEPWLSDL
jgi:para-nitrobenzyl esterase